jgi:hypothetical protein
MCYKTHLSYYFLYTCSMFIIILSKPNAYIFNMDATFTR